MFENDIFITFLDIPELSHQVWGPKIYPGINDDLCLSIFRPYLVHWKMHGAALFSQLGVAHHAAFHLTNPFVDPLI